MNYLVPFALIALLLSGCASDAPPQQAPAAVEDRTATPPAAAPSTAVPLPPQATAPTQPLSSDQQLLAALKDPNHPLSKRSVFFDFDSFEVKPEYKGVIETHARFLVANPRLKVFLQGHTDERGTPEYNLALGTKRAEAVRKMMALLGVKEEQMEAVSFGEEKPRATCHDESCWSQNRRTDIVYAIE